MRHLLIPLLVTVVSSLVVLQDDVPLPVDPEALMSVVSDVPYLPSNLPYSQPEMIRHWGYPAESHQVTTADGYVLTLHRIPHGRNETAESVKNTTRPVVFLQHGLMCSSSMWVLNLPHQSAGFMFADAGYDVWMGNSRGNIYSRKHVRMTEESDDFWRFTWQQMAEFDLPASIDGVLNATNQTYVYFVGHSQGALSMFAKQAVDPAFAPKIRQLFALAPVARLAHVQGAFSYLGKMYDQAKGLLALFGDGQFLRNNLLTRILADLLCDSSLSNPLCTNLIFSISGPDSHQFNNTRVPIYLAHNPAGTSIRNMVHFSQMVHNKRFAPYDLGKDINMKLYGAPFAPEYDVSQIASPTYLFYSDADWLASPEDVEGFLMRRLNSSVLRVATRLSDFNHNDFMWGLRARKEIYDPIDKIIRQDVRRQEIRHVLTSKDGKEEQSIKVLYNKKSSHSKPPRRLRRIIVRKGVHSSINSISTAALERAKMKRDEEKS